MTVGSRAEKHNSCENSLAFSTGEKRVLGNQKKAWSECEKQLANLFVKLQLRVCLVFFGGGEGNHQSGSCVFRMFRWLNKDLALKLPLNLPLCLRVGFFRQASRPRGQTRGWSHSCDRGGCPNPREGNWHVSSLVSRVCMRKQLPRQSPLTTTLAHIRNGQAFVWLTACVKKRERRRCSSSISKYNGEKNKHLCVYVCVRAFRCLPPPVCESVFRLSADIMDWTCEPESFGSLQWAAAVWSCGRWSANREKGPLKRLLRGGFSVTAGSHARLESAADAFNHSGLLLWKSLMQLWFKDCWVFNSNSFVISMFILLLLIIIMWW